MGRATSVTVKAFGVLASIAGIEHGIGAVLQGNVPIEARTFESWPESEAFRILDGEPAMTLVPNYLITGVLAILASIAFLVWATMFSDGEHGGLGLLVISAIMLLVGAGFGPPLLGVILGITATRVNAPLSWWEAHFSESVRHVLASAWPWSLAAGLIVWLTLFPGSVLFSHFFGVDDQSATAGGLITVIIFSSLSLLLLTILAAFAYDIQK